MKSYILLVAALLSAPACNSEVTGLEPPSDPAKETFAPALGVDIAQMTRLGTGVYYSDLVVGTGPQVSDSTESVNATYSGYLKDGTLFDSGTNTPFIPSQLIPGFRDGVRGMKEGGRRKIVVPSEQGYGGRSVRNLDGSIKIPRQSTLVFDVELLKVTNPATT